VFARFSDFGFQRLMSLINVHNISHFIIIENKSDDLPQWSSGLDRKFRILSWVGTKVGFQMIERERERTNVNTLEMHDFTINPNY
jgi:hypothetical protein